jgi:hypothetical protein
MATVLLSEAREACSTAADVSGDDRQGESAWQSASDARRPPHDERLVQRQRGITSIGRALRQEHLLSTLRVDSSFLASPREEAKKATRMPRRRCGEDSGGRRGWRGEALRTRSVRATPVG